MAYNITQLTNYDLEKAGVARVEKNFILGGKTVTKYYYVLEAVSALSILKSFSKMGYCCEPKGIGWPIYLTIQGESKDREIYIGKSGMFEFQEEEWEDVNNEIKLNEGEKKIAKVVCTGVKLPARQKDSQNNDTDEFIKFTFDYCYKTN